MWRSGGRRRSVIGERLSWFCKGATVMCVIIWYWNFCYCRQIVAKHSTCYIDCEKTNMSDISEYHQWMEQVCVVERKEGMDWQLENSLVSHGRIKLTSVNEMQTGELMHQGITSTDTTRTSQLTLYIFNISHPPSIPIMNTPYDQAFGVYVYHM